MSNLSQDKIRNELEILRESKKSLSGNINVTMNGFGQITEFKILDIDFYKNNLENLETEIVYTFNETIGCLSAKISQIVNNHQ